MSQALDKIVSSKGRCLYWENCQKCPFFMECLTKIFNGESLSAQGRVDKAMTIVMDEIINSGE